MDEIQTFIIHVHNCTGVSYLHVISEYTKMFMGDMIRILARSNFISLIFKECFIEPLTEGTLDLQSSLSLYLIDVLPAPGSNNSGCKVSLLSCQM